MRDGREKVVVEHFQFLPWFMVGIGHFDEVVLKRLRDEREAAQILMPY